MNKKLMIFIPSYKSQRTICSVIERIPNDIKKKAKEIVVFDDDSPDDSYKVLLDYKKKKKMNKLKVHKNKKNLDFGGNMKVGFDYAIKNNMSILAVLHSDGQYPSERIGDLIKPIEEGEAHTTFGSRFLGDPLKGGMPLWRYLGNIFLTKIENILVGKKFSEWHSGFTAYDCNALKKLPFKSCADGGYELATDILLLFLSRNFIVKEFPIKTHYGKESTSPSIKRTFSFFVHCTKLAFLFFLHRMGIIQIDKYKE
ncbi:MAG: glycosyltransferase family 2 protein [Nanoarchaeota archaeon]